MALNALQSKREKPSVKLWSTVLSTGWKAMVSLKNASGKEICFLCVPGMPRVFLGHGYWIGIYPWELQRCKRFVLARCRDSLKPCISLSISLSLAFLFILAMWSAKLSWSFLFKCVHISVGKTENNITICCKCILFGYHIKYHYYLKDITEIDVPRNDTCLCNCLWLCKKQKSERIWVCTGMSLFFTFTVVGTEFTQWP